ncbi:MAG TPA: response regulator transcription factor [Candidatus Dormibacteraeota bacterium]|nr:response regulator transcription factor [Candidatus Dormibacteraeota bacterium]
MIVVPAPSSGSQGDRLTEQIHAVVVDRQPLFRAALANLLEGPPLSAVVVTAPRSDLGLDMALEGGVDIVFCEVRAEPLTGVELVHALMGYGCGVPVVLLGDDGDEPQLTAALSSSVAGVFTKNSALEEFLVGVRAVVSGHRAIGSGLLGRLLDRTPTKLIESRQAADRLSPTELAILAMIGQAQSIPAIAASRGISHKTVRNHLAKIYRKLDLHGRTEAMLWAARMGLTGS